MLRPPTVLSCPDLCTRAVALAKQGRRRDYIARVLGIAKSSAELFLQKFYIHGEEGGMPDTTSKKSYSQQTKLDAVQAYLPTVPPPTTTAGTASRPLPRSTNGRRSTVATDPAAWHRNSVIDDRKQKSPTLRT